MIPPEQNGSFVASMEVVMDNIDTHDPVRGIESFSCLSKSNIGNKTFENLYVILLDI